MIRNTEVSIYGLMLVGSGISELVANQLSEDPSVLVEYAGLGFLLSGLLVFLLGLLWKRDPLRRPLGVFLLSAGLGVVGVLTVFLGGWVFTPLFLLAFVCFAIAYGLITGRGWALFGMFAFVTTGFGVSLAGIGNGGVVNVAGVLSACYLFWYLGRKHVAKYFKIDSIMPTLSRKSLTALLIVIMLILVSIGFLHLYPPSSVVESAGVSGSGGPGASTFTFHKNDWINYTFQSHNGYSPLQVSIRSGEEWGSGDLIASENANSGSLTATIPFTGTYTVYYDAGSGSYSFDYKLTVTFYSWRSITPLWALLGLYGVIAVLAAILKTKTAKLVDQELNLGKETENEVDR